MKNFSGKILDIKYIILFALSGVISSVLYLRLADMVRVHHIKSSTIKISLSDQEFTIVASIFGLSLLILLASPIIYGIQQKNRSVLTAGIIGPVLLVFAISEYSISLATGHVTWTTFIVMYLSVIFIICCLVKTLEFLYDWVQMKPRNSKRFDVAKLTLVWTIISPILLWLYKHL